MIQNSTSSHVSKRISYIIYLYECENSNDNEGVDWEKDHPLLEELMGKIKSFYEVAGECVLAFQALQRVASVLKMYGDVPEYLKWCINDIRRITPYKKRFGYFFDISEHYYRIVLMLLMRMLTIGKHDWHKIILFINLCLA